MKNYYVYFIIAFCLISCKDDFTLVKSDLVGSGRLSMKGLSNSDQYVNFPNENLIINDSLKWNRLVVQMDSVGYTDYNNLESGYLVNVKTDFSRFTVIACFDVSRMHNGYLEIVKILEYNSNIEVHFNPSVSVPGPYLFSVPEAFCLVKIKTTNKPVSFVYN